MARPESRTDDRWVAGNLYGKDAPPFMVHSGMFGRCRHGCTHALPCLACGLVHPLRYLRHRLTTRPRRPLRLPWR